MWDRYSFLAPTDRPFYQSFRKSSPGMIQKAKNDFEIDLTKSSMIGDRDEDEKAAIAAGLNFAGLGGYLEHRHKTPIGIQVLWRGWLKLHDKSEGWQLAKET